MEKSDISFISNQNFVRFTRLTFNHQFDMVFITMAMQGFICDFLPEPFKSGLIVRHRTVILITWWLIQNGNHNVKGLILYINSLPQPRNANWSNVVWEKSKPVLPNLNRLAGTIRTKLKYNIYLMYQKLKTSLYNFEEEG